MNRKIGLKLMMTVLAVMMWFVVPEDVKAATSITGGETKEEAVEVELEKEYVTTNADGWFKITTPEYTKYIGAGYDKYTDLEAFDEDEDALERSWNGGSYIPMLGEQTEYWDWASESFPKDEIGGNEEYFFHVSTTKAENCTFKIVCGIAYDDNERQSINVNQEYSSYSYLDSFLVGENNYQFIAKRNGYCKFKINTSGYGGAFFGFEYKDYSYIYDGQCAADGQAEYLFEVSEGMTYYLWISPNDDTTVTFSISDVPVSSIALNSTALTLKREEQFLLEPQVLQENAVLKTVTYSSSKPNVATVSENGWVKAVSAGTSVITCMANDGSGVYAQCVVNVLPIKVQKIDLSMVSLNIDLAKSGAYHKVIDATVYPQNADDTSVSWFSSNPNVVSVTQNGTLRAKKVGTAIITCRANDGSNVKQTCTVKVGKSLKYGTNATVSGVKYKVTSKTSKGGTVMVTGVKNTSAKKYVIPDKVQIEGYTYRVESIGKNAFSKCKNATTITIGSNVKTIEKQVFYNCKKLRTLTIKSKNLKTVGKDVLKNVNKKLTIKVPSSKLTKYKKLFKNKGQAATVQFKKM